MGKPEVTMMSREEFSKLVFDKIAGPDEFYVDRHELEILEAQELSVPVIKDLDARILEAIDAGGKFDMLSWHEGGSCGTAHCRGGWAVHLAGADGYALEEAMGVESAAACIYLASTGRVPDFFCENEEALEDMRRCAAGQT